jgi:HD superfamily phosphohydrolase
VDSRPFQRLRHIYQLGMTHLLYPGATHRRFEHSLGVMELASRVFDVVTRPDKITDEIKDLLPELANDDKNKYWRRALRMAALCHDVGHLPFSHTAEKDLLPYGWDHERLTREIICGREMQAIWQGVTPPLRTEDLVKLAIGPKKAPDFSFSDWETILSEIIVGDAFGVDRMDYLLRDSHHIGVAYGRFDHYRLIDTLRILTAPPSGGSETGVKRSKEPSLGVEEGGLQSAEALLLARYFMYTQAYFHPVRRIYDIHLKDFLREWLPEGTFPTSIEEHLALTDNEINSAIALAAAHPDLKGSSQAQLIVSHQHFKPLYRPSSEDLRANPDAGMAVYQAAQKKFGAESVRYDRYAEKGEVAEFPVFTANSGTVSSTSISRVLGALLPAASVDCVFIRRTLLEEGSGWLRAHKATAIHPEEETP